MKKQRRLTENIKQLARVKSFHLFTNEIRELSEPNISTYVRTIFMVTETLLVFA